MSKKAKIIVSSVCAGVILIVLIIGIVLSSIKRYDIREDLELTFNNHTTATSVKPSNLELLGTGNLGTYHDATFFTNGTRVMKNSEQKKGLFSYIENKTVVDFVYDEVKVLGNRVVGDLSYFMFKSSANPDEIKVFDHNGNSVNVVSTDSEKHNTYGYIMTRDVSYSGEEHNVKAKIKNKHVETKITVKDVSYKTSYYLKNEYHYEVWNLTDNDGATYENLYEVKGNGKRELIQTLNGTIGNSIDIGNTAELGTLNLYFLTDGTPRFRQTNHTSNGIENIVYDINYNKLNSSTFNINLVAEAKEEITFVVGDYEYTQFTINATEDKYDFAITNNAGILEYYKLETYRLDLSNGNLTSIDMEYKVQQVMDNITNNKIALVYIQEIKDKLLDDIKNVILNEKLQQKEIDYTFNRIIKINDERYIANYTETNGLTTISINYLIDENYDLIANLENYNTLFTTRDSIIVGDSTHQYICNLDGIIIKKVAVGSITDINNADYYMVTKTNTVDEKEVTTYYLENKGLTNETAIHTSIANDSTYTYGEHTYVDFDIVNTPNLNLIVRTREVTANNATTYTYEFYNMENKLLYTATEQGELNQGLSSVYEDKDYIIVNFNGGNIVFDK